MDIDETLQPLSNSRKRAASSTPEAGDDDNDDNDNGQAHSGAARARVTSELDELGMIPTDQAWDIDLASILQSHDPHDTDTAGTQHWPHSRMDSISGAMMLNLRAMQREPGVVLLCVLGQLDGQYWLLRALLPVLRRITPALRAYALAADVPARRARLAAGSCQKHWAYLGGRVGGEVAGVHDFPLVQPGNAGRTFTRLGLSHPLGGGREPLDAVVVLDCRGCECKRRLVLPFGWGAGRLVSDEAGGWMIRGRLMEILREGVEQVSREQRAGR